MDSERYGTTLPTSGLHEADGKVCSIYGCGRGGRIRRTWCSRHYHRWQMDGDPQRSGRANHATPEESFLARTEPLLWDDHLIWAGADNGHGYGTISVDGKMVGAHRYAWERENGPVPDGLYVDHVCHVRACVEISHLRLATNAQNLQNRAGAVAGSASRYRGVSRGRRGVGWRARVADRHGGTFPTEEEAAMKAEQMRKEGYGEFAGRGGAA